MAPPVNGAITGIQLYFQSGFLPFLGNNEYTIRGPKSLAGFIAYPVVPPSVIPITITKSPTGSASKDPMPKLSIGELFKSIFGLAINKIPNTRPFAYFSRLVILEDYRKLGIRSLLDDIRIEYLKKNENIKFAVAWAISKRHNSLEELGFNNIGSNNYSWANGFSEELSMYLKINTQ